MLGYVRDVGGYKHTRELVAVIGAGGAGARGPGKAEFCTLRIHDVWSLVSRKNGYL